MTDPSTPAQPATVPRTHYEIVSRRVARYRKALHDIVDVFDRLNEDDQRDAVLASKAADDLRNLTATKR